MPGRNCYAWRMALTSRLLASGAGWQAEDVICDCGPADRPFEEQHEGACLAIVGEGTFSYRSTHGTALLVPGALLLGNPGACFECSHEHSRGDRCLSFHLAPEFMDEIATQLPGARKAYFSAPRLPPIRSLMPVLAAAEGARDGVNAARLEELAIQLVAEALKLQSASDRVKHPSSRDTRRVASVVHWLETHVQESLTLSRLARMASMSRYHFLRTFRTVTGTTPYQYLLSLRLRHVSAGLARTSLPICTLVHEAGFGDLSTFNRRFRHSAKLTPRQFRWSVR